MGTSAFFIGVVSITKGSPIWLISGPERVLGDDYRHDQIFHVVF